MCCISQLTDGRLVSGSGDTTLRLWDVSSGSCLSTLRGHTGDVTCVLQLDDGRLVSGSSDHTLIPWTIKSVAQQRWERRCYFLVLIDTCLIPRGPFITSSMERCCSSRTISLPSGAYGSIATCAEGERGGR